MQRFWPGSNPYKSGSGFSHLTAVFFANRDSAIDRNHDGTKAVPAICKILV